LTVSGYSEHNRLGGECETGFGVGDLFASVSQIVLEKEATKTEKIPRNTGVAVGETSAVGGCCS
jgi:hypothetical protein